MRRLLGVLDRGWFVEAPPSRPALLRIVVGLFALQYVGSRYAAFVETAGGSPTVFEPVGPIALLRAPLPIDVFSAILTATLVANVAFVLGLLHRLSGPIFGVLLLLVLSYRNSWSMIYHTENLLVFHALILGLTRSADALSIDALLGARLGWLRVVGGERARAGHWQYGYPIRLMCAVTVAAYFVSGVAKVAGTHGWGWATGEVMRDQVAFDGLRKEFLSGGAADLVFFLYRYTWIFTALGILTLVVELGAPLVLLNARLGYGWAFVAYVMHWGILVVMEITFRYQLTGVAFASFFPIDSILLWLVSPLLQLRKVRGERDDSRRRKRSAGAGVPLPALAPDSPRAPVAGAVAALALEPPVSRGRAAGPGWLRTVAVGAIGLLLVGIGFAAGLLATGAVKLTPGSPTAAPAAAPAPCPAPCDLYRVVFVGDLLVGDKAQPYLDREGYTWPFEQVRGLLAGDFVIGNAEAPFTERRESYFPQMEWDYHVRPRAATALAEVGFKGIGLSNNHVLDRGPEGLADTLQYLRAAGIQPFGAGMDADEAGAPLLIPTQHGTIAVLGFGDSWRQGKVAAPGQFGTIPYNEANIVFYRDRARAAGARWVVAFVHWGGNYEPVRPQQRRLAASFAKAGYDLVVGHHPHIPQEVDYVEGMPVLYSLGNFVFGTEGRFSPQAPGYGLVARTAFGNDGIREIELACILTDNEVVKHQPRPCDESQARQLMGSLGPHVTWRDGRGYANP